VPPSETVNLPPTAPEELPGSGLLERKAESIVAPPEGRTGTFHRDDRDGGARMQNRVGSLILGLGMALAFSPFALAQNAPQMPTPSTANSKTANQPVGKHSIDGAWMGTAGNTLKTRGQLTDWGKQRYAANKPFNGAAKNIVPVEQSNDPFVKCDPMGFPRSVFFETRGIELDALPKKMLELFQYQKIWREIWMDGRQLPKNAGGTEVNAPDPRWYGYSVGHWADDTTFVADTVGMDERTWMDALGDPHSVQLKTEERYRRVDHDDLELTMRIDDPIAYVKPFETTQVFRWNPKGEVDEQMCVPSEAQAYFDIIAGPAGNKK
jgi:hypothetical protein